ncbi:hypothetical protein F4680DRAFT_414454 [Xylaria scruposa]|nr:hypothetical protein F4680DRAFT_414454 [Xylaria scruposa]
MITKRRAWELHQRCNFVRILISPFPFATLFETQLYVAILQAFIPIRFLCSVVPICALHIEYRRN